MPRLVEQLHAETQGFHADADADVMALLGPAAAAETYCEFLAGTYGFVSSVESAVRETRGVDALVDVRRFHKHELLRRDLRATHLSEQQIDALPRCTLPWFADVEEAMGWAYVVERSMLGHSNLFRHLATVLPGEMAFASSYLKCYFGAIGEMWRAFGDALERLSEPQQARRVIEAAKAAFRTHRAWARRQDTSDRPPSDSGDLRTA